MVDTEQETSSPETMTIEQKETFPTSDFPEGGSWGWLTLAGATLVQYCTFGYTNAFGVYQDYYVRHYLNRYTPRDIGWIGGAQIFFVFTSGIVTGRAVDRGYFHYLIALSTVLHALALFTLSVTQQNQYYQIFLAQGVCLGLSSGLAYVPSLTIVSHYFQRRRPLAMGIVAAGSALGAVLHPIMLNNLFKGRVGFHNGIRISAALNTFLLVVANLIMRTRLPPKKQGPALPIKDFLSDPPYLLIVLASLLIFFGFFYPVFYLQLNAITHGIDPEFAFYSLSILNAASIFGRAIPPMLSPKLGVFNLLSFFALSTGIVACTMSVVDDVAGTALFAIFYGFCSGATIGLTPPAMAVLSRDVNELGARIGINFGLCGILGLFATPIAGELLTESFNWLWVSEICF
ncbi:hypothetical protein AX16_007118 [Volvariella volvacea WC 439]|nr:hypothetical protein AX16_007118 [Volvariella volvacea WC 439]